MKGQLEGVKKFVKMQMAMIKDELEREKYL